MRNKLNNLIESEILNLKQDNTSGASELIYKALKILDLQLDLIQDSDIDIKEEIFSLSKELISSRPSMAPLINTIGFLIHDLTIITKIVLKKRLKDFKTAVLKGKLPLKKFSILF